MINGMIKAIGLNKPQLKTESLKKLSYAPLLTNSKFSKNKNLNAAITNV
jgi:hypothetical protein